MADIVKVAKTNEIEPGQTPLGDVKGKSIALFNVDGQFFALDNTCTHRGGGPWPSERTRAMRSPVLGTAQHSTFGQERSSVRRHREPSRATMVSARPESTSKSKCRNDRIARQVYRDRWCLLSHRHHRVGSGLTQLPKLSPLDEVNARTDA